MLTSDLIQDVRDQLDQPESTYLTTAMILRWLNEAQRDIARETRCIQKDGTFATVAGTSDYTLTDVIQIDTVWSVTQGYMLREIDTTNAAVRGFTGLEDGTPYYWGRWDDGATQQIWLYPTPVAIETFIYGYTALPTALVNGLTEEPEIPEDIQAAMTIYAQHKYKWQEGEYAEAETIRNVYKEMVRSFKYNLYTEGTTAGYIDAEAW
jgi:hypothetical protein